MIRFASNVFKDVSDVLLLIHAINVWMDGIKPIIYAIAVEIFAKSAPVQAARHAKIIFCCLMDSANNVILHCQAASNVPLLVRADNKI
jgi:hypothetical protein